MHFGNLNVEEITDVEAFKKIFFPGGFESDNAGLTVSQSSCMHKTQRDYASVIIIHMLLKGYLGVFDLQSEFGYLKLDGTV